MENENIMEYHSVTEYFISHAALSDNHSINDSSTLRLLNVPMPGCLHGSKLSAQLFVGGLGNVWHASTMELRNGLLQSQVVISIFWLDCDETSEKTSKRLSAGAPKYLKLSEEVLSKGAVFETKDRKALIRLIETLSGSRWHERRLCAPTRKSKWPVHAWGTSRRVSKAAQTAGHVPAGTKERS